MKDNIETIVDDFLSRRITIEELHDKCLGQDITTEHFNRLLYPVLRGSNYRNERFKCFIALYDASSKRDPKVSFMAFKDAYCGSDNIYNQIKDSPYPFDIKSFVRSMQQKINLYECMTEEEKIFFDDLQKRERFEIYRGMSDEEYSSGNYGISWSLCEQTAWQYAHFKKNNIQGEVGVKWLTISGRDIVTVFSVQEWNGGEPKIEIIYLGRESYRACCLKQFLRTISLFFKNCSFRIRRLFSFQSQE